MMRKWQENLAEQGFFCHSFFKMTVNSNIFRKISENIGETSKTNLTEAG
jgi:hypothetical protein